MSTTTLSEAARQVGVSTATLRRWAATEVVPLRDGCWTTSSVAYARVVARLRDRGHSLADIQRASASGRLAYGYMEELFPVADPGMPLSEAARRSGLDPALVERVWSALGFPAHRLQHLTEADVALLGTIQAALDAGFPLVAFLQLIRVYGQALAQIADAEVRLFHLYVHEPLIRDGLPAHEMADQMERLARELLPLASPVMDHLHQGLLRHFVEQDVVGHLESDTDEQLDIGRVRVAIAFIDLAGFTRLTEEVGDRYAVGLVERFQAAVEITLPDDARIIKSIGDAVMVVSSDPAGLCDWAVGFQRLQSERPLPRIGMHQGAVLYRDGDYYGREVNLAARVGARAAGGEVLVTRSVVEGAGRHLDFERVGEVTLKGFAGPTELFVAKMGSE
ncbi:MAG: MerR family transcriptional regulator [Solirubrobacterales bacterium]|jgi:adenylate cyclase|nr:MerR family transcriptional regulator [Solirubrobacterales bacterium]